MLKLLSVYRACICVLAVLIVTLYSLSQGDLDYSFSKNINVPLYFVEPKSTFALTKHKWRSEDLPTFHASFSTVESKRKS